jgi:hypothetical protein
MAHVPVLEVEEGGRYLRLAQSVADVTRFPALLGVERACSELDAFARSEPACQPDAPAKER